MTVLTGLTDVMVQSLVVVGVVGVVLFFGSEQAGICRLKIVPLLKSNSSVSINHVSRLKNE